MIDDFKIYDKLSNEFQRIIGMKFDKLPTLKISGKHRKALLDMLIKYYEMQLEIKKDVITSHKILEIVFED